MSLSYYTQREFDLDVLKVLSLQERKGCVLAPELILYLMASRSTRFIASVQLLACGKVGDFLQVTTVSSGLQQVPLEGPDLEQYSLLHCLISHRLFLCFNVYRHVPYGDCWILETVASEGSVLYLMQGFFFFCQSYISLKHGYD